MQVGDDVVSGDSCREQTAVLHATGFCYGGKVQAAADVGSREDAREFSFVGAKVEQYDADVHAGDDSRAANDEGE